MPNDDILVTRDGPVATVTINRPAQRNAISYDMWGRFSQLFGDLDADTQVRVVLLTGAGEKAFSAGADIKDFEETRSTPAKARDYRIKMEAACEALDRMSKPSIAVVRGYCIGGGFELSLSADLRIADETAQLGLPAAKRGLAISHTIASRLIALAGAGTAKYILLTGCLLPAGEAFERGILAAVHPTRSLDQQVAGLASEMAALSAVSHRLHKEVIRDLVEYGAPRNVPAGRLALPNESETSIDFEEGVRAFLEKRDADFKGS
jgi:enoyl-CoA hydratase/carnithine racemase